MARVLVITALLLVGFAAIAVSAVSVALKLAGALVWIALAAGAFLLWRQSRSRA